MNTETHRAPSAGNSRSEQGPIRREAFVYQVGRVLRGLPDNLEHGLKQNPYRTLTVAALLGVGVGIVFGSRILRTAAASVVAMALVDLGKGLFEPASAPPVARTEA